MVRRIVVHILPDKCTYLRLEKAERSLSKTVFGQRLRWRRFCDDLGCNKHCSLGPLIVLNVRATAKNYVSILTDIFHPMVQTVFSYKPSIFQDDNVPIHISGIAQHLVHEQDDELEHFICPPQSSDINIIGLCGAFWKTSCVVNPPPLFKGTF